MSALRLVAAVSLAMWLAGCGPERPPTPPPPRPTKESLLAEGRDKVKRALAYIEEMEAIRDSLKPGEPSPAPSPEEPSPPAKGKKGKGKTAKQPAPPPPQPSGEHALALQELDRLLERAREAKDQLVAMREELAEVLEKAPEPLGDRDIARAQMVLRRMNEKLGDVRDGRTRALELKPKPPQPESKEPAKAPGKPESESGKGTPSPAGGAEAKKK